MTVPRFNTNELDDVGRQVLDLVADHADSIVDILTDLVPPGTARDQAFMSLRQLIVWTREALLTGPEAQTTNAVDVLKGIILELEGGSDDVPTELELRRRHPAPPSGRRPSPVRTRRPMMPVTAPEEAFTEADERTFDPYDDGSGFPGREDVNAQRPSPDDVPSLPPPTTPAEVMARTQAALARIPVTRDALVADLQRKGRAAVSEVNVPKSRKGLNKSGGKARHGNLL